MSNNDKKLDRDIKEDAIKDVEILEPTPVGDYKFLQFRVEGVSQDYKFYSRDT